MQRNVIIAHHLLLDFLEGLFLHTFLHKALVYRKLAWGTLYVVFRVALPLA